MEAVTPVLLDDIEGVVDALGSSGRPLNLSSQLYEQSVVFLPHQILLSTAENGGRATMLPSACKKHSRVRQCATTTHPH
eukprot:6057084-Pleurochrysis_carterae.AAC.1